MVSPGSLRVYPIEGVGAVQMGVHRFDERGASTSTLTRFVHVWRFDRGAWRLARVLSLDHHTAGARFDRWWVDRTRAAPGAFHRTVPRGSAGGNDDDPIADTRTRYA